ncbi:MAG: alcohol dehydrogenase catalytic domain-containing protein [Cytophagales bacterium]|nr:alcohol dehydrogenase catalytic domain-containing protein [Cytophagales bacterium]
MRALIIHKPFEMRVGNWQTPRPQPGEVVVAVATAGVCAGDLFMYQGKNPYATYPVIGGHEIAGIISAVGEGVESVQPGTPVVVEPFISCGGCYPCRVGKPNCCTNLRIVGVHRPGGFADYVAVPAANVYPVPPGLPLAKAVIAEPVSIALQACRRGEVTEKDTVLVMGCGPIGMYLIEVARARGARVLAADVNPERLAVAARLGAVALPSDAELPRNVLECTNGEGVPVVIEATGVPAVVEQTVDLVAAGGRIVIVGLVKGGVGVTFPGLDFTRKELTILGSRTEVNCFPESLRLLASGAVRFAEMSTFVSMWQAPKLFAALARQPSEMHKAVLVRE